MVGSGVVPMDDTELVNKAFRRCGAMNLFSSGRSTRSVSGEPVAAEPVLFHIVSLYIRFCATPRAAIRTSRPVRQSRTRASDIRFAHVTDPSPYLWQPLSRPLCQHGDREGVQTHAFLPANCRGEAPGQRPVLYPVRSPRHLLPGLVRRYSPLRQPTGARAVSPMDIGQLERARFRAVGPHEGKP